MKKKNNKKSQKNTRMGRNIYAQRCITKEVTLTKENAIDQYIEVLDDIERHRKLNINIEYDVKMPKDVFSQEEIAELSRKMSALMMLRYGVTQMAIGEATPMKLPLPMSIA